MIEKGDNSTSRCEDSGKWSPLSLTCLPVPCGVAPYVENSTISYKLSNMGFTAQYTCHSGFVINNRKRIE